MRCSGIEEVNSDARQSVLPITRDRGFLNTRRPLMNVSREPWDGPVAVEEDESRRRGQ